MEEHIHKYFRNELSKQERLKLLRMVEDDPDLKDQFIRIKNVYALSTLTQLPEDLPENKSSLIQFHTLRKRKNITKLILKSAKYAAIALLLISITYIITINKFAVNDTAEMLSFHVPAGQRMLMTLPDGTEVWLNSQTTMIFPSNFTSSERRVNIDGEAFFDVAENKDKPFIVSSKGVDMKVLGTRFNVYAYSSEDYLRTSLIEGSLKVYHHNEESQNVVLSPNQQITIKDGKMVVGTIKNQDYFLWTQGIFSYDNEPLSDILKKMELYFDVTIEVQNPSVYEWEYRGKFRQNDGIDNILKIINKIHKFKVEKNEETNTIVIK